MWELLPPIRTEQQAALHTRNAPVPWPIADRIAQRLACPCVACPQERERQRELELIKQQYLGAEKQKKKVGCQPGSKMPVLRGPGRPAPPPPPLPPTHTHTHTAPALSPAYTTHHPLQILKATERMKFVFDWDAAEDTSRDLNPLYQNLHGGAGLLA